jgi:hypothetical protein
MWVDSFCASSARRALCSITRATASRSNGRSFSRRARVPIRRAYSRSLSALRSTSSSKSAATLNSSPNSASYWASRKYSMRLPNRITLTSSGIGSGSSDTVLTRLYICPSDSMRTSRVDSARFRAFPGKRLAQQLEGIQQQVAAVGQMQRPRLDQQEVGDQRTQLRDVLDPSHQVLVGGVVLVDHRRPAVILAADQQVDQEAAEVRQLAGERGERRHAFLGMAEFVDALDDVLLHLVEVVADSRVGGVIAEQVVDQVADGEKHCLLVELAHSLDAFAPPKVDLVDDTFQALLQAGDRLLDVRFFLGRQLVVVVRAHHLVVLGRGEGKAIGGAQQNNALLVGVVTHCPKRMRLAFAVFLVDLAQAAAVFLALEHCRDGALQFRDQLLHVVLQARAHAGGKLDRARLVRLTEIVDVAPVGGLGLLADPLVEKLADQGALAAAGLAHDVEVVAGMVHADAEMGRFDGAHLADAVRQVLEFRRGRETEAAGIASAVQAVRGERRILGHVVVFAWAEMDSWSIRAASWSSAGAISTR